MFAKLLRQKTLRRLLYVGTAAYATFLAVDVVEDLRLGAGLLHMLLEMTVATVILAVFYVLVDLIAKMRFQSEQLKIQLSQLEQNSGDTRLLSEIDRQLTLWELSPAEKEIAFLLLKGLTNKEIANIRKTSGHTIKQQASAVYRKSGLKTRAEISAFFLDGALPPPATEQGPQA